MANTKISALTAATTPDGTELVPVVQGGVTKKATVSQLTGATVPLLTSAGSPEGVVTGTVGQICEDTTNGVLYVKRTGTGNTGWVFLGGASIVAESHSDTTVVNTLVDTPLAQLAIPTNVAAGDVLEFEAFGDMLNNTGGNVTYQWKGKIGATTPAGLTSAALSIGASATRRFWAMRMVIIVESVIAQRATMRFVDTAVSTAMTTESSPLTGYGTAAEDLSAGKNVLFTVTMGTANSLADMVCHGASLKHIPKAP